MTTTAPNILTADDYKVADLAIQYLQKYRDRPFFLACGFTKPHSPPTAPKNLIDLYDPAKLTLPRTFAATPTAPASVSASASATTHAHR